MIRTFAAASLVLFATQSLAIEKPRTPLDDPMNTGMWDQHQRIILGDPADIAFDDRVRVTAPASAEDPFQVPVLVDATSIPDVKRIVVFVDFGPIPPILTFYPGKAQPRISFRFKIDQATPVRAAVEDMSGRWHVGQTQIDAAGGGCTAPAAAYAADDWRDHLGEVQGRVWREQGRVRFVVDHPMDTGLANGIPRFIVEKLALSSPEGKELARLELHEPVSEDPAFTLYFAEGGVPAQVRLSGRDSDGNDIGAMLNSGAMR